jgi:hypothetical protein
MVANVNAAHENLQEYSISFVRVGMMFLVSHFCEPTLCEMEMTAGDEIMVVVLLIGAGIDFRLLIVVGVVEQPQPPYMYRWTEGENFL